MVQKVFSFPSYKGKDKEERTSSDASARAIFCPDFSQEKEFSLCSQETICGF